jgi:hypothetical protein
MVPQWKANPIIIKQTLAHDIIIKELKTQGEKVIVQGGKGSHQLSKGFPIIIMCNILKPSAIMLWVHCPKVWDSLPSVNQYDHICRKRAHMSIIPGLGDVRG